MVTRCIFTVSASHQQRVQLQKQLPADITLVPVHFLNMLTLQENLQTTHHTYMMQGEDDAYCDRHKLPLPKNLLKKVKLNIRE